MYLCELLSRSLTQSLILFTAAISESDNESDDLDTIPAKAPKVGKGKPARSPPVEQPVEKDEFLEDADEAEAEKNEDEEEEDDDEGGEDE